MPIKLAGKSRATLGRPRDLNKQLIASTGCGENELDMLLSAGPDRAAKALRPWLEEGVLPGPELARAIASDPSAIDTIRALYATPADAASADAPEA